MSVSAVASRPVSPGSTNTAPPRGPGKDVRDGMESLKKSLASGDLSGAKAMLEKLQSAHDAAAARGVTPPDGQDRLGALLEKVGTAVSSGDLSAAQDALSKFGPPHGAKGPPPGGMGPPPGGMGPPPEVEQGLATLSDALEAGNADAAEAAFGSLAESLKAFAPAESSAQTDPLQQQFSRLGEALKNKDLAAASNLFAQMTRRGVDTYA